MSLPSRWQSLHDFFVVLLEPLLALESPGLFVVEANGPDGEEWTDLRPHFIDLSAEDPALAGTRTVACLCGACSGHADPSPEEQGRRAAYYTPASLIRRHRSDDAVLALAALVIDVDDRNHGGRVGTRASLARAPTPTFVVHSGGGVQAGYVLREALVFDRADAAELERSVRAYLSAALGLQYVTGADPTHWPSHLFRCPGAYHLKDLSRPVLVTVEVHPERRFNLADFDELTASVDEDKLDLSAEKLIERLTGKTSRRSSPSPAEPLRTFQRDDGSEVVRVPGLVSREVVALLNYGFHPNYEHEDGTLDRSRAVYAAAMSLVAAGVSQAQVEAMLSRSAIRGAVKDRGKYGPDWLHGQVEKAAAYLERATKREGGAR